MMYFLAIRSGSSGNCIYIASETTKILIDIGISYKVIAQELKNIGISYSEIVITDKKAEYIRENNITIFFENTDEYFLELGEETTVFKIRESGNFSFSEKKWYGNRTTTKMID